MEQQQGQQRSQGHSLVCQTAQVVCKIRYFHDALHGTVKSKTCQYQTETNESVLAEKCSVGSSMATTTELAAQTRLKYFISLR